MSILNLKEGDKFFLKENVTIQDLTSINFSPGKAEKFLRQRKENKSFTVHKYGIKDNKIYFDYEGYYAYFLPKMVQTVSKKQQNASNHFFTKMFLNVK